MSSAGLQVVAIDGDRGRVHDMMQRRRGREAVTCRVCVRMIGGGLVVLGLGRSGRRGTSGSKLSRSSKRSGTTCCITLWNVLVRPASPGRRSGRLSV